MCTRALELFVPSVTQTDNQTIPAVTQPFKAPATTTAEKTVIPPRPRMSELAHDYEMRLEEIMEKLNRQNRAIHTQEVKKDLTVQDYSKERNERNCRHSLTNTQKRLRL